MKNPKVNIKTEIKNVAPKAEFEFSERQLKYLKTTGEVALAITLFTGVVAVSAVAPNIFTALDKIFGKKQYGSRRTTLERRAEQLARSFYYWRRQNYVNIEKRGELLFVSPTKKGLKRMQRINFDTLQITRPRKWQGTWWIVLADIPRQLRTAADAFQKKLKQMDFYPLQRTVWVHAFDPRSEVESVATHYRVSPFITIMEVKHVEPNDEETLHNFFRRKELI